MNIYNSILSRFGFSFLSFLLCATFANAAAPVINSVDTLEVTVGEAFTYVITTVDNDAVLYGTSNNLPDGVVRSGATLSGEPEVAGVTTIDLFATNGDGTGTATLILTVLDSLPVITSATTVTGRVDEPFSYTIEATNSPGSFSVLGLDAVPNLNWDSTTGIITGTPTATADTDIQISATNDSGTASQQVTIMIFPAVTNPTPGPTVNIISPLPEQTFEGSATQISVSAGVEPQPNQTIDTVFVRWNNSSVPGGIVLTEMTAVSEAGGVVTYTGTLEVGFNPSDRQIGGGLIDIDVVAFQTNALSASDSGEQNVKFRIKPIVEFLFPDEAFAIDAIVSGDVFASVRLSTNQFDRITARIAGPSIIATVVDIDATDNPNGVFNFLATQRIDFPGFYDIRITALDGFGNTTFLERRILISDSLAQPVAVLTAPTPGFTNEVFSAAIFSFAEINREFRFSNTGVFLGTIVTYAPELISGGQGYYPRNAGGVTIPASAEDDTGGTLTVPVPDVNVVNGRVDSLPDVFPIFYFPGDPEWVAPGNAVLDDFADPGSNGWISLAAQFFKANSELSSFRLFVNGEDVTPRRQVNVANLILGVEYEILTVGSTNFTVLSASAPENIPGTIFVYNGDLTQATTTGTVLQTAIGNLDPLNGLIDTPVTFYPGPGRGSPAPGDYLAYAQVTDRQGEVGNSAPLAFTIVPYEPLEITLTGPASEEVEQGTAVEFEVEVTPNVSVESVEFFDSDSGESLGFASGVEIEGKELYRFIQSFNQIGNYGVFVRALAFNGQSVDSSPFRLTVTPLDDLEVNLIQPTSDQTLYVGGSLDFVAEASSSAGVTSVSLLVDNVVVDTAPSIPYRFNYIFDTAGGPYNVRVTALDNYGNVAGATEEVNVTVIPSNLTVEIDSPTNPGGDLSYTLGDSIDLEITANDVDAFVTQVEIFNGETSLGIATGVGGDQYRYTIDTATAGIAPGTLNLSARATNNIGNNEDALLSVNILPVVFSVSVTEPTENPLVLSSAISPIEQVFSVEITAADAAAIQSVQWYFADELVAESAIVADTLIYTQSLNLSKSGELRVEVTDVSGASVEDTVNVIVDIGTPLNSDEAFVRDAYVRLTATEPTDAYVATAVALMDGTVDGQVAYLQALFDSSDMDETEQVLMVYRTMTGEWPDTTELDEARAGLFGGTAGAGAQSGSIEAGGTQAFPFFYNAGDIVTVRVTGSGEDPLSDPTLVITNPSGVEIAFDDDGGLGLNPLVNFTATEAGTYSASVAGFSIFQSGDFTISSITSNSGDSNTASAQALVQFLIPEFEARFNRTFPISSVTSATEATSLVEQLFKNKHGRAPEALSWNRLQVALTGSGQTLGGLSVPGYTGNLSAFTAAFALDNELSQYSGLTSVHYYQIPNQPINDVPLALMIAMFLGEDPTDQALAAYAGMTQAQAFESIITDPRYYEQFPSSGVESFVSLKLADLGVFDKSLNGPADDADDDGVSNLMEIALGSDPSDPSDTIEPMETGMEGTEFVITFIRIKASEVPGDFIISLECAMTLTEPIWDTASDTASVTSTEGVTQDGVPEGYERVEIRIDTNERDCGFFRLSVDLP